MIAALLMQIGQTAGAVIFAAVVITIVIRDHFLPDSADEELRRTYRGAYKRRRRRGEID